MENGRPFSPHCCSCCSSMARAGLQIRFHAEIHPPSFPMPAHNIKVLTQQCFPGVTFCPCKSWGSRGQSCWGREMLSEQTTKRWRKKTTLNLFSASLFESTVMEEIIW